MGDRPALQQVSKAARFGKLLFLLAFVVAFGAVGLFSGSHLWRMLQEASRLPHYVPVPAQVLDVHMEREGSRHRHLVARYRYQHEGRTLAGDRIAWSLSRAEQNQWHTRLASAQQAGQSVTAWIDPEHPGLSLLEREFQWRNVFFLLPFALAFPAVSLGALWALIRQLRPGTPERPSAPRPVDALRDDSKSKAWGITIFTLLWNVIAFPIALLAWADHQGWGMVDVFVGLFPAVGLLMAWASVQYWRDAFRHRGSHLTVDGSILRAGEPAGLTLTLPARGSLSTPNPVWKARLVQSQLLHDDSERTEQTLSEQALSLSSQPSPGGGEQLRMTVHWPQAARASGLDKAGHRITWRLVVEAPGQGNEQVFELPVQPGRPGFMAMPGAAGEAPLPAATAEPVPPAVMSLSQAHGIQWASFHRPWRISGALACSLLGVALAVTSRKHFHAESVGEAAIWLVTLAASMLAIGLALHVGTRRWVLGINRDAWHLDRSSNLRRDHTMIRSTDASTLVPRLTHTNQAHGQASGYHRLEQQDPRYGHPHALTPPLPGLGVALGVAQRLQSLRQQAGATPAIDDTLASGSPSPRERSSTITAWLLLAVVSLAFSTHLDASLSRTAKDTARAWLHPIRQQFNTLAGIGQADRALLTAIDHADERAVRAALDDGANASATSDSGRSSLMLAAGRGLLPIMDLLIQRGADVNYADQVSVNERGDTALLMAAYFGQAQAFERLLAAGARTNVVNRWDWTPVHMAAAGDCLPCLEPMARRGLSLNARATASRGESPLQMAAAKGRISAMQWLIEHGADPSQLDDHGQDVMAWARFFKQGDSERWLQEHLPVP